VSTDVLRGGVDDGTRTQRERLLQHGRGEGVVDDGRDAGVAAARSIVGRSAMPSSGLVGDSSHSRSAPSIASSTSWVFTTSTGRVLSRPSFSRRSRRPRVRCSRW